jgi:plastocyanin
MIRRKVYRLRRLALLGALVLGAAVLLPAGSANAETKTFTERVGPITIGGYEVQQSLLFAPKPPEDGHITAMDVEITDADGTPIRIQRLMLHHIVFLNLNREDETCKDRQFKMWDNRPAAIGYTPERFYAAGEERAKLILPPGYGYSMRSSDRWMMAYMVMNHRAATDSAYIQYRVTYETGASDTDTRDVTPYWLDVRNCSADPIYNIPGTDGRGSTHRETYDYVLPEGGRIVAAGGHVHGGGKRLTLTQPGCGNRLLGRSTPTWGLPSHAFYNVRPVLHEPGPINMSAFGTPTGIPIAAGERVRLNSLYDNDRPHTRVMGIMVMFVDHDPAVSGRCGSLPNDIAYLSTDQPGRRGIVPFRIPLTGLDENGNAITIEKPPGRNARLGNGATIRVGDRFFSKPNVVVERGARLRWLFDGIELHNLTLANGPVGIGSPNLDDSRAYSRRFGRPGTYKFFCALHPVQMHQRLVVKPTR